MKNIGALLKSKREEMKISLEEVAVATKISIKVLQALEEGDTDKLPAKPFIRGFVQSYAKYLALDQKEILELFSASMGTTKPETQGNRQGVTVRSSSDLERNLSGSGRNILTIAAIIITIIGIIIIQRILAQREAEMRGGEVQAITGNDSPVTFAPSPSASGTTSPTSESASPGESPSPVMSAPAALLAPTATPTVVQTPTPTPTPTATPTATATPTPTATATPKPTPTPTPSPTATPEALVPQEIIIEALDHVILKIATDAGAPQDVTMNADQILTFKGKRKITVATPNGGAISIIHNGREVGVPGNLGQPKTMVFGK